jgi:hypothetical protein
MIRCDGRSHIGHTERPRTADAYPGTREPYQ